MNQNFTEQIFSTFVKYSLLPIYQERLHPRRLTGRNRIFVVITMLAHC